uniref:Cancer/testis antigen 55 n=2 Tax=Oryctolagus cuniculus TaxID=9986 RepID=U3KND0_RABIT|nr:cancer/testis antigen 55 [Oryctolagus cuniculus]
MQPARLQEGDLARTQGEAASADANDGFTAESAFFVTDVSERILLSAGQHVTPVVEDETSQVDADNRNIHGNRPSGSYRKVTLGCLNSLMDHAGRFNHTCFFSVDIISTDFDPYPHDCVEVTFFIQPDMQRRKVLSVKPRRHKRLCEVCITSVNGRNGVIGNSTVFILDCVKLPDGYVPRIHDVVNAVVVETVYLGYVWRAVSIIPVAPM